MGIKGFANYLKSIITEDGFAELIEPKDTILLIDASAFAFYVMNLCVSVEGLCGLNVQTSDDFNHLSIVVEYVKN